MTCLTPKVAHITPVLMNLHWLPVNFRVEFEIALLVFTALMKWHLVISETYRRSNMKAPIN